MKRTPMNQDLTGQVGPDNYPLDWNEDTDYRGLTRSLALRLYVVQLSVGGKQRFIGNAYNQNVGATLYDYALWKFAGKIPRPLKPNFPAVFGTITQELIDRDAPRLNEVYGKLPFIRLADEQLPEAELRSMKLSANPSAAPFTAPDFYLTQLRRLKRIRLAANENYESVTEGITRLDLRKLPDTLTKLNSIVTALSVLSKCLIETEESMESQHDYYRKVRNEKI